MSIQLKKTLIIPKSSSKAANPTTDDTMAKENLQKLIYKTLCQKLDGSTGTHQKSERTSGIL
jgi:phage I-like protein